MRLEENRDINPFDPHPGLPPVRGKGKVLVDYASLDSAYGLTLFA